MSRYIMSVVIDFYRLLVVTVMPTPLPSALVAAIRDRGVVRSRDLTALGINRSRLQQLVAADQLRRVARGIYIASDHDLTEKHSLAVACTRVPSGVVCLLSALVFHGLTVQNPWEVWLAIDPWARKPAPGFPPLRIVRCSGAALTHGVEHHEVEGATVRVFSIAKTIADLFKYRNKVGLDVALEALREAARSGRVHMDDVLQAAEVCRVATVIRPYLESLS